MLHTMLIGGIAGGIGVLVVALVMPKPRCKRCGVPAPRFRKPDNARQAVIGGWTCACGAQLDRRGNPV